MNDPNANLPMIDHIAGHALGLWDLPADARAVRINVSENVTYRIDAQGAHWVLRVHRPHYHTTQAILSEIAWVTALRDSGIVDTPSHVAGRDGAILQRYAFPDGTVRHLVLFEYVSGEAPNESADLSAAFHTLGEIAARTHLHSMAWHRPEGFQRLHWNLDAVFGATAHWGNWRDAPNVTHDIRSTLEQVETTLKARLVAFGRSPDRYGLIHADMRLANLILSDTGTLLIDFDDCGFGWYLYDFAAAISFIEDTPQVPVLKQAWLAGYGNIRPLPEADIAELDSFILLRRMALLAWIGSHINAPEPQTLAPSFAEGTAKLGRDYLERFSS